MNSSPIVNFLASRVIRAERQQQKSNVKMVGGRRRYNRLDLRSWSDTKCKSACRFTYDEIRRICVAFGLDTNFKISGFNITRELAMAILLNQYSFPRRLEDMVNTFGISVSNIGRTISFLSSLLFEKCEKGIKFDERQFSAANMQRFSKAIYDRGAFYTHIIGFIDGTMQQISRPVESEKQKLVYNGSKHMHCLKYQAVTTPDGITSSLYGPYNGRKSDREMLNESGFLEIMSLHLQRVSPDKNYMLYGDEGYSQSDIIITPFAKSVCTAHQLNTNKSMSKVRVAVEMDFGKVSQYFPTCKWKFGNKVLQTKPGLKYVLSTVFKNLHTCINGSSVSSMFNIKPPTLEEYINNLTNTK